ncbi:kinase-like domain-containing protein [Gigaspora rosea]|uniref:Kinase-like domain-containing protein n=1 Tax=Gigaspora rosea TaxID=44941 RepID=A0A397VYA4_9GLOM|nr:kinase-like domain-containing protein [Gigaspora rosea]
MHFFTVKNFDNHEKWVNKAIIAKHINGYEYKEFTYYEDIGSMEVLELFINMYEKQLKLLQQVHAHPNIIGFYGVTKDNNGQYNMILEYAEEGNLHEYLETNFTKLQWTDKFRIAYEISCGLAFEKYFNSLRTNQNSSRSKVLNEMSTSSNRLGMLAYIEPDRFMTEDFKLNKKSDIYSLGIILWEISSGRPPLQFFDQTQLCLHVFKEKREPPIEGTPSQYVELYKECWDGDPTNCPERSFIRRQLEKLKNESSNKIIEMKAPPSNNKKQTFKRTFVKQFHLL